MATVHLNQNNIDQICWNARAVIRATQGILPSFPMTLPEGVADEVYSLALPVANEKTIRDNLPNWAIRETEGLHISINDMNGGVTPYAMGVFKSPHIELSGWGDVYNVPGFDHISFSSGTVVIYLATDGTTIESPILRQYVEDTQKVLEAHKEANAEVEKAAKDLEVFLSQHRTLQSAIKECEAIWEYVPRHIRSTYERKVEPRPRKPKTEKVNVDMGPLVAYATTHKLGLNP